jgi:cysteine desulfurase
MAVNNEIGVIQPLREIGEIIRKHRGVYFHTDAAQAVGKIPLDVNAMNIDVLSISGHKLYGPKGIGAAYVRRRPRVRLEPIMSGGGQERGLRSGSIPAALVVGLGEAANIASKEMAVSIFSTLSAMTKTRTCLYASCAVMLIFDAVGRLSKDVTCRGTELLPFPLQTPTSFTHADIYPLQRDHARIKELSDRLINGINAKIEHVVRNGDPSGFPGCVNLSFAYVEGESLLMALKVRVGLYTRQARLTRCS